MQRGFRKALFIQPATHPANHLHIVIHLRDDEIGDFHPYACLLHGEDGVKHGLQVTAAHPMIDVVAKRLQVYVGGIQVRQQVGKWLLAHVARRDEDIPKPGLVGLPRTVNGIFKIGQRLGIGVGNGRTAVLQAERNDVRRRQLVMMDFRRRNLRYFVVLTVQAAEIATRTGQRQTRRTWMEVVQRLFLYGVDGQRAGRWVITRTPRN